MKVKTPYYLIYEEELNNNISCFKRALNKYWPNSLIAYSIKTNSLPWILKYLKAQNIAVEAVSDEEYQLAKLCGFTDNQIIFNGPIKTEAGLKNAFENHSFVNIDSENELEYLCNFKPEIKGNLGIRVNIDPQIFLQEDIGYQEDGFRFGFSVENGELEKVINQVYSIYGKIPIGLHLHCNSITRSIKVYCAIARYCKTIIKKYNIKLSYIDIGGGFFGGVEGKPNANDYIKCITNELRDVVDLMRVQLIVEPGSAIIGSTVDLCTTVIDSKHTNNANIITTDGSRILIDPLWKKTKYLYSVISETKKEILDKQIICGYTCMDHDRIMNIFNYFPLKKGDKIIYHKVGSYTMTFGGPFIRYFPEVYVQSKNSIFKVRRRMNTKEYYDIYSNEEEKVNE
ncbi:type III PLP-dependent enzyme domain-containing protein [Merdibacter massiliensis]|uniref:diaminopimelate decarboxylase n=1 Tax=Merdibacter massiliensis TaxID=1871030 RepID=UPI00096A5977|nr:diaminopimelate decarboxylase [Merdibacter massiliensis]